MADIKNFLVETFDQNNLSFHSLCRLASVDIKSDEAGLTALASSLGVEIAFFSTSTLNKVDRIKTPSKMAEKHIGVKSVCEASAILAADRLSKTGQGELILTKQKNRDVTVAVAIVK